jgi:hypothetical protein
MRSIFFTYPQHGGVLGKARDKVAIPKGGTWKDGGRWGDLVAVDCPTKLGTAPLKQVVPLFLETLAPALKAVVIDTSTFEQFLNAEDAENKSWTLRFWEVDQTKGLSRTITVGREVPEVEKQILAAMSSAGRGTVWAGAEFRHPKFDSRVMVHRWPTAAIAPWGQPGSGYAKVKDRFIKLLHKI